MIDSHTGSITIDNLKISPQTSLQSFMSSNPEAQLTIKNEPWQTFKLKINNFVFLVVYNNQTLSGIRFSIIGKARNWSEWNEAEELQKQKEHDKLLKQNLGEAPYQYDWGSVESVYDQKTGGSEIIMRFHKGAK